MICVLLSGKCFYYFLKLAEILKIVTIDSLPMSLPPPGAFFLGHILKYLNETQML